MVSKLMDKVPKDIKTASLMALIYFLYSIFDSRYALKAEVNNLAIDIAVIKTKMINVEKNTSDTKKLVTKFLED